MIFRAIGPTSAPYSLVRTHGQLHTVSVLWVGSSWVLRRRQPSQKGLTGFLCIKESQIDIAILQYELQGSFADATQAAIRHYIAQWVMDA